MACRERTDPKDERMPGRMRPSRSSYFKDKDKAEMQKAKLRFVRRYRRVTTTRALKPWTPLFSLDGDEVTTTLAEGRL